jgi:hypothetical protein
VEVLEEHVKWVKEKNPMEVSAENQSGHDINEGEGRPLQDRLQRQI